MFYWMTYIVYLFLVKLQGSALPSSYQIQSNGLLIQKRTINETVHRFGSGNNIKKQSPIISSSAFVLFKRKSAISQQLHFKPRKKNRRNSGPVFRRLINCFFVFLSFFFFDNLLPTWINVKKQTRKIFTHIKFDNASQWLMNRIFVFFATIQTMITNGMRLYCMSFNA